MKRELVIVIDFGGQYNQLIARRVRECNVYCEIYSYKTDIEKIKEIQPKGIIFTGGPNSVYLEDAPHVDPALFDAGVPVLGSCYGCQLMAHLLGGQVTEAQDDSAREYGKTPTYYNTACKLFKGLPAEGESWMSHGDYMAKVPEGFELVAHTDMCPTAAIADEKRGFYGVQYHPEVNHTENGSLMLKNFLSEVCHAKGDWTMGDYKNSSIKAIREKVGDDRVILALSGGVDSSVVAALGARAVGKQMTCVFINHGLLRKGEPEQVEEVFTKQFDVDFIHVHAEDRYAELLAGVTEPEEKRRIIGTQFWNQGRTEEIRDRFIELAISYNIYIITGSMPYIKSDGGLYNVGFLCRRDGSYDMYEKVHVTPDEVKSWGLSGGRMVQTIDTDCARIGVLICYDVEFPELSRIMADQGMQILFVPFLTDTQNGYSRVRVCAQARAFENECFVAIAGSVGNLPRAHNMDIQYAQSGVFTPCDFAFPTDGKRAEATPNTEMIFLSDVDLD